MAVTARTTFTRTGCSRIAATRASVSGDDFYYGLSGNRTLPLGTVTAVETKAPEGYILGTPFTYVSQIVENGDGTTVKRVNYEEEVPTEYNTPTTVETPERGNLCLRKRDADIMRMRLSPEPGYELDLPSAADSAEGDASFADAEFEIVNRNANPVCSPEDGKTMVEPGGVVCTIRTDASGYAATNRADLNGWPVPAGWHGALAYGRYELREKKAPSGYAVNTAWVGTGVVNTDGGMHEVAGDPLA